MEVAGALDFGQRVEFLPVQSQGMLNQAGDAKVPGVGVKSRDRAIVQDGPFERERLARGQQALAFLQLLELSAVGAFEQHEQSSVFSRQTSEFRSTWACYAIGLLSRRKSFTYISCSVKAAEAMDGLTPDDRRLTTVLTSVDLIIHACWHGANGAGTGSDFACCGRSYAAADFAGA